MSFLQKVGFGISSGVAAVSEDPGADGIEAQLPGAGESRSMDQELLQLLLSHGNWPEITEGFGIPKIPLWFRLEKNPSSL